MERASSVLTVRPDDSGEGRADWAMRAQSVRGGKKTHAPGSSAEMAAMRTEGSPRRSLANHWPEYAMEAFGLGLFMVSACAFGSVLEYPGSPVHQALPNPIVRRVMMGAAMGMTNIVNIYSPWGKQSGAHLNPAVTWTFFRLGKVKKWDAIFY